MLERDAVAVDALAAHARHDDALEHRGAPERLAPLDVRQVHLSDVDRREEFRRVSVLEGIVVGRVSGEGVDGYRTALERIKAAL